MSKVSHDTPVFSKRLRRDILRASGPQHSSSTIFGFVEFSALSSGNLGVRRGGADGSGCGCGNVAGKSAVAAGASAAGRGARRGGAGGSGTSVGTVAGKSAIGASTPVVGCEILRGGGNGSSFVFSTVAGNSAVGATVSAAGHVVTLPLKMRIRSCTLAVKPAVGAGNDGVSLAGSGASRRIAAHPGTSKPAKFIDAVCVNSGGHAVDGADAALVSEVEVMALVGELAVAFRQGAESYAGLPLPFVKQPPVEMGAIKLARPSGLLTTGSSASSQRRLAFFFAAPVFAGPPTVESLVLHWSRLWSGPPHLSQA